MDKLTWQFELLDRMSGPASKIDKSLGKLGTTMKKESSGGLSAFGKLTQFIGRNFGDRAAGAFVRFGSGIAAMGEKLGPVAKSVGSFGASAGKAVAGAMLSVGAAALAAVGTAAVVGGKFVADALTFKEDSLTAFEAILGSKAEAQKVMAQAVKFASVTPFKTSEVVDMAKSLLTRGFKANELEILMKGVGDVGAMLGTEKMDSVINALGKMRATGQLTGETMQMLADAGINSKLVLGSLAKQLNTTEDAVKKMISAGQIKDPAAIKATMDAIAKGLSGGELGGAMAKKALTITGLMSTLSSIPEELVFAANMGSALEPIKKFITDLTTALSPDSVNGKRLIGMLEQIGKAVGDMFGGIGAGELTATIGSIIDVVEGLFQRFLAVGKGVFAGFGAVVGPVLKMFAEMGKDPDSMKSMIEGFTALGKLLGFIAGVLVTAIGGIIAIEAAIAGFAGSLITSFKEAWASSSEFFDNLKAAVAPFIAELKNAWSKLGASLSALASRLGPAIDAFRAKLAPLVPVFQAIWDKIGGLLGSFASGTFEAVLLAIGLAFMSLVEMISFFADAIMLVVSAIDTVIGFFDSLDNQLRAMSWGEIGTALVQSLINGILSMLGPLGTAIGGVADLLKLGTAGPVSTPKPASPLPGASAFNAAAAPAARGFMPNAFAPGSFLSPTDSGSAVASAAIQPAAGAAPTADPPRKEVNLNLSGLSAVFNITSAENGEQVAKEAAGSFMGQLGSALTGLLAEAGG